MTVSFFTHTDWFYAVNPFCSSLNCCFRLQITVHRLAVLLAVFWRKKRAKSVSAEKWKSYECRSYLFSVSMKLQFHKTWITLTSNSKMLQIFFSCAYNTIYTFAKFLLRLQILFALAVLCTLSQILPYACKSLWRKITFIHDSLSPLWQKSMFTWTVKYVLSLNHISILNKNVNWNIQSQYIYNTVLRGVWYHVSVKYIKGIVHPKMQILS